MLTRYRFEMFTMKTYLILAALVTVAVAESLSKSYLPPPPSKPRAAASQGKPSRGERRQGYQDESGMDQDVEGYGQGTAYEKNSYDENRAPANYNFNYKVNDLSDGTDFGRKEQRQDENAQGQYHVVLPDGRKQTVNYEADGRGFKPRVSYEDSETGNGGYDSNANNYQNGGRNRGNDINGARNGY